MAESAPVGLIGGSGFSDLDALRNRRTQIVETPYGMPSCEILLGEVHGQKVVFLARHGIPHSILPHEINYRANLWALRETGVSTVVAIATVGGISASCSPGSIVVPDQILDYTYSRCHTFVPLDGEFFHVDFTEPYSGGVREIILSCANELGIEVVRRGTYAATQGPRFETAAEIRQLELNGADIVGMTGMPEAGLARELGLCYATIALVVNHAAGKQSDLISVDEIDSAYRSGFGKIKQLVEQIVPRLKEFRCEVPQRITP